MHLIIDTSQPVDLRTVKAERTTTGAIWLRHPRGDYSLWMDDEAARELVAQLTAILDPSPAVTLPSQTGPKLAQEAA